ncbi:hypothetical protein [Alteromonas gilva]|uniref:HNH domain-containing protein n=1 Tax=Alteromonas gilva TaxID=2987522 RepID=A0ABT5KXB1_9ALTE|nr:hypothetical protein [Alteromonas gilva]MDC8829405.1 hypothetical protein [Alteromonas gilva]
MSQVKSGKCVCCSRITYLTFHHLIPRKMHRRAFFKKHYSKEQLASGVLVCRQCHNGIHRFYDEMTLAKQLSSLSRLKADAALADYFAWVSRQRIKAVTKHQ